MTVGGSYFVHMDINDPLYNDILELIIIEDYICNVKHIKSGLTCSIDSSILYTNYREIDSDMVNVIHVLYQ